MKFILTGGVLAFLSGFSLFPGLVLFIGASIIAIVITIFISRHMDAEFEMFEKSLISLLINVCLAVGGATIIPEIFDIDIDDTFTIIIAAGSVLGTFLGGIFAEFYEPEQS